MPLYFEVSEDEYFQTLVVEAEVSPEDFGEERDFTVNLDLEGLLNYPFAVGVLREFQRGEVALRR